MKTVSIARDFSPTPSGRFGRDGPFSGEAFRVRFLEPAVDAQEAVTVELDAIAGLSSSFLEEAFGGLYRRQGADPTRIRQLVRPHAEGEAFKPYVALIERYMSEAAKRFSGD
ncbi:MAG: STAS-like domain-containing protein [Caulobacter sp.]